MFVDIKGAELGLPALEVKKNKDGKRAIGIWWNRVPSAACPVWKINVIIEGLEKELEYKETKTGCRTIARTDSLKDSFFVRYKGNNDPNCIEVCGIRQINDYDCEVFRYVVSKASNEDESAYEAWLMFKDKVQELCGESLSEIFGGLPREFHKYRTCVPKPIDWVNPRFEKKELKGCVKADICSAYGNEASKPLPDLHSAARKVVDGKVEPNEEWPFAFYLESGEMAIWGEGISEELKKTVFMHSATTWAAKERTLLCKPARQTLRPVFEWLYSNRKENELLKFVMNATIGMFHRKAFTGENDNLWPLAAVIKFRCDKRIADLCEKLYELGQVPVLINTDSITWRGGDTSFTVTEKALGNFRLEYADCSLIYCGPKKYQIYGVPFGETEVTTLTRWAGPHRKSYTEKLAFGAIVDKEIVAKIAEEEKRNMVKWDKQKKRFVDYFGDVYTLKEELEV